MSAAPWLGGQRVTAERLSEMLNKYSNWTPTWGTVAGAAPSYGNATVDCRYAVSGDLVTAYYVINFGSTSTYGAGDNWTFTLPVPAAAAVFIAGSGWAQQDTFVRLEATPRMLDTTKWQIETTSGRVDGNNITGGSGLIDALSPWTWASGNGILGMLHYEKA